MRIGIFGGTFDPPHLGHLILAEEARYQLKIDRLLFVPTPDPPHKQHRAITQIEDRLAMVAAAVADNPNFEISRVEIDRPGPHYTLDTVNTLKQENPGATMIYLMGADSLRGLPHNWDRPGQFVAACDYLGVMRRPEDVIEMSALEAVFPGITEKTLLIDAPLLEIASRQIRQRAADNRPYRYYLPPSVCEVIRERNLYQSEG